MLHFYLGCAVVGGVLLVLRTLMLLAGFGAGLSAAAASVEISPTCDRGVVEL